MATFLSLHDLSTHVHDPLLLELQGIRTLSVNVFDQEEYLGCLTVFEAFRPLQDSDRALSIFLAKLLRQAVQQNPTLASTRSAVRAPCAALSQGSLSILSCGVRSVRKTGKRTGSVSASSQSVGQRRCPARIFPPHWKNGTPARWPLSTSVPSPHFYRRTGRM